MSSTHPAWTDRSGGCLCGAVRYRVTGTPLALLACHCTDCQVRSGGAFTLSLPVIETDFEQLRGEPQLVITKHEDREKHSFFCTACHTRLWHRTSVLDGVVTVKAGTLDKRDDLVPVAHMWLRSRQPWLPVPESALHYQQQPDNAGPILEAWQNHLAQTA